MTQSSRGRLILWFILLASAYSLLFVTLSPAFATSSPKKRVLILHSFHKGQKWNDDLSQGIIDVLKNDMVEVDFEYMDAKRNFDEDHFANLYQLYRHKYRSRPADVVISTDESALDFLLTHREEVFPNATVVFCGVKYLDENKLFGEKRITGVIEQVDIEKNIQLIQKLTPNLKHMLIITDNSPTSISTIKSFMPVLRAFKDRINFHFTEQMAIEELQNVLQSLSKGHTVLLVNYTKDINGKLFSMKESARTIAASSPVPVYALWDSYLGNGILGGLLVSGYTQGKIAARMAQALLRGENVQNMPVKKSTAGHYMFDFQQLKAFGIKERKLPVDSIVINQPISFYYQYKMLILGVFLGILSLTLIILVLSINILRRKRVEKSLKKTTQRLTLMHEIDRAILDALSIKFVAESLMEPMQQVFGCEIIGILLIRKEDPQTTALVRYQKAGRFISQEFSVPGHKLPLEQLKRGKKIHSADFPDDTPLYADQWSE
ncbi:MAG: hypothetical protein HOE30_19000, partial [Deltaproteobacteria bacterium]|nr:hypothetical protein [Deltaproteobacteria bacterium]